MHVTPASSGFAQFEQLREFGRAPEHWRRDALDAALARTPNARPCMANDPGPQRLVAALHHQWRLCLAVETAGHLPPCALANAQRAQRRALLHACSEMHRMS
jgi:hypothetical protein